MKTIKDHLFKEPLSYEYADCSSPTFLLEWSRDRSAAEFRFDGLQSFVPRQVFKVVEEIRLADILSAARDGLVIPELRIETTKEVVDLLTQKFEIFRRLRRSYDPNLKANRNSSEATIDEYIIFGNTLADFSEKLGEAKYLSTILKLIDALCGLPDDEFDVQESRKMADLIRRERKLINFWVFRARP